MPWTAFLDVDVPGTKFRHIYIEAPKLQAIPIFEKMFKTSPESVACPQCKFEFLIEEYADLSAVLEDSMLYFGSTIEEFTKRLDVLFLDRKQIQTNTKQTRLTAEERVQEVCQQTGGLLSFEEGVNLVRSAEAETERLLGMYRGVLRTIFEELKKPELARSKLQGIVKNALAQS